jgi:hypothetical protein
MIRKILIGITSVLALSLYTGGCTTGGVGDPCVPEDEYQPTFSGFTAQELNIESRSFQCETRVCLVDHFRGRVSCPLGQTETDIKAAIGSGTAEKPQDPALKTACRIPGTSGSNAELVSVTVQPQCQFRRAVDTVYCSCRCDGPDKDANYCACPDGFSCKNFQELELGAKVAGGSAQLQGSYCVKNSVKAYAPGDCENGATPDTASTKCDNTGNCGNVVENP